MTTRRALHFVFKVANRKSTIDFYRNVLGMKVLRHEEFEKGCEAACNGPYDGKWSKTMIGYGEEDNHFVIELTYNYGIKSYKMGNDFVNIGIYSKEIYSNAEKNDYPVKKCSDGSLLLADPNGYKFVITDADNMTDPVKYVTLAISNLQKSIDFWHSLLGMNVFTKENKMARLGFSTDQCALNLQVEENVDHAEAYGRIAFSCSDSEELKDIEKKMNDSANTVLTPYISLDTPGKATVQVVIIADPDGHEICFVGDIGFRDLSKYDPNGDKLLDQAMLEDKSDEWFERKEARAQNRKM